MKNLGNHVTLKISLMRFPSIGWWSNESFATGVSQLTDPILRVNLTRLGVRRLPPREVSLKFRGRSQPLCTYQRHRSFPRFPPCY